MYCKKICYKNTTKEFSKPNIIYGVIKSRNNDFIIIKTSNKNHEISTSSIISIEDSKRIFKGEI